MKITQDLKETPMSQSTPPLKVLLIKTSSMGDVIHTLPALTDAYQTIPTLEVDWVIEPTFADIASWHPAVKNIIPFNLRKWRHHLFAKETWLSFFQFWRQLRKKKYDLIIDAQGLVKSLCIALCAHGPTHGYGKNAIRDPLCSYFYRHRYGLIHSEQENAIQKNRVFFSKILGYPKPTIEHNFSIDTTKLKVLDFLLEKNYLVFLHGTTWDTKLYPEEYWQALVTHCDKHAITVYLPWGNDTEKNRAETLAKNSVFAKVLPKLSISTMATVLNNAMAIVSVDTGFGHLCAALEKPTIALYGPTDAKRLAIAGNNQLLLQADFPCSPCNSRDCLYAKTHTVTIMPPCFSTIGPDRVWLALLKIIEKQRI